MQFVELPPGHIITIPQHHRRGKVRLYDEEDEKEIFRFPIDARELLTRYPDRYILADTPDSEAFKHGANR